MKEILELPSAHQLNQVVKVYFSTNKYGEINKDVAPLKGTIRGAHFYPGKVKYDVELFWNTDDGGEHTRIYNIDSIFIVAE
jgi:hypothetical protein